MFFTTRLMSWKGVQVLLFCLAAKIGQLPAPPAAAIATFRLRRPTVIGRANFCTRCPIGLPIALQVAKGTVTVTDTTVTRQRSGGIFPEFNKLAQKGIQLGFL